MPPICLDDVWMPPVHTQHKESMLCQTKGVSICPHTFGWPQMLGCTPVCLNVPNMFGCPHMFGHTLYVWIPHMFGCPPVCLDTPICLHSPYVWMPLYVWMPPYVWTPNCLVGCSCIFLHPLYVLMLSMFVCPPICLDAPKMYGSIQRYEGHPNIWVVSKYMGVSKHTRGIQIYGGIQRYRGHMDTLLV